MLQATWIGYPNSTGLSTVDYRITDGVADPEDTQQSFTEQLLRLPGCFLCYTPAQGDHCCSLAICSLTLLLINARTKVSPYM